MAGSYETPSTTVLEVTAILTILGILVVQFLLLRLESRVTDHHHSKVCSREDQ